MNVCGRWVYVRVFRHYKFTHTPVIWRVEFKDKNSFKVTNKVTHKANDAGLHQSTYMNVGTAVSGQKGTHYVVMLVSM